MSIKLELCNTEAESLTVGKNFAKERKTLLGRLKVVPLFTRMIFGRVSILFIPGIPAIIWAIATRRITIGQVFGGLFGSLLLALLVKILSIRSKIRHELRVAPSVKVEPTFQDQKLIAQAWQLPVGKLYGKTLFQPVEGYCGHATLNNLVHSLPPHDTYVRLPPIVRPMDMMEFKGLTDQIKQLNPRAPIKSVRAVWGSISYDEFMNHIRELNNPNVRIVANFLRGPLFFSDPKDKAPIFAKLFAGHWSPVAGYLPDKDLVFVLDVNEKYGCYLIPSRRFYDSVNTQSLFDGMWRGLIRVDLDGSSSSAAGNGDASSSSKKPRNAAL